METVKTVSSTGSLVTESGETAQFALPDAGKNGLTLQQGVAVEAAVPLDAASERLLRLQLGYAARVDFSAERALKRVLDAFGAVFLAAVFSPLIVVVCFSAFIAGQPLLFRHKRVGRDGVIFDCLKFQTMVPNAEAVLAGILARDPDLRAEWESDHKLKNDPRVTPFGKFLRSTSLDELPQLWNVLKGDMSLVGPRPVTPGELLRYGRNAVIYMLVRPGLTGLWQVSGRNFVEYRKRVAMDVCYVRNQSAVLDTWILIKTVVVVLTRHGAH
jgi:lipopolysaccharide/colanic/teichoic acid biosynthesis glycosyltransferase